MNLFSLKSFCCSIANGAPTRQNARSKNVLTHCTRQVSQREGCAFPIKARFQQRVIFLIFFLAGAVLFHVPPPCIFQGAAALPKAAPVSTASHLAVVDDWSWVFAAHTAVQADACAHEHNTFAQAPSPVYEVVPGVRLSFKRLPANCSSRSTSTAVIGASSPEDIDVDYVYVTMWMARVTVRSFGVASISFSDLGSTGGVFACARSTPMACYDSQGTKFVVRKSTAEEVAERNMTTIETGTSVGANGETYDRATFRLRATALLIPSITVSSSDSSGSAASSTGRVYGHKRVGFALGGGIDPMINGPTIHATSTRADVAAMMVHVDSGMAEEIVLRYSFRFLAWIIVGGTTGILVLLLGLYVSVARPQGEGCGLWLRATTTGPLTWFTPLSSLPAWLFMLLMLLYLVLTIKFTADDYSHAMMSSPIFRAFGDGATVLFAFVMIPPLKHVNLIATRVFGAPVERLLKMHAIIGMLLLVVLTVHFAGMWHDLWSYRYGLRIFDYDSPRRNLFGFIAFATFLFALVIPSLLRHLSGGPCGGRISYYTLFKALHWLWIVVFVAGAIHQFTLLLAIVPGLTLFVLDRVVVHAVTLGASTHATAEGLRPGGDAVDDRADMRTLVVGADYDERAGVATIRLSMRREVLATTVVQWLSPLCLGRCCRKWEADPTARVCLFRDLPPAQYVHLGRGGLFAGAPRPFTVAAIEPAYLSHATSLLFAGFNHRSQRRCGGDRDEEGGIVPRESAPQLRGKCEAGSTEALAADAAVASTDGLRSEIDDIALLMMCAAEQQQPQQQKKAQGASPPWRSKERGEEENEENTRTETTPQLDDNTDGRVVDPLRAVAVFHIKNMGGRTFTATLAERIQVLDHPTGGGSALSPSVPLREVMLNVATDDAQDGTGNILVPNNDGTIAAGRDGYRSGGSDYGTTGNKKMIADIPNPRPAGLATLASELNVTYGAPTGLLQVDPTSVAVAVLVCGGIGITPMGSLLEHLARRAVAAAAAAAEGSASSGGVSDEKKKSYGEEEARAYMRQHCGCDRCVNGQWKLGAATRGGLGLLEAVHLVWANRGPAPVGLLEDTIVPHVALLKRFSAVRVHLHLYDSSAATTTGSTRSTDTTVLPTEHHGAHQQAGRPDLAKILDNALDDDNRSDHFDARTPPRDPSRVGVFSCGPPALMAAARLEAGRRGLCLHKETFHF